MVWIAGVWRLYRRSRDIEYEVGRIITRPRLRIIIESIYVA
jgi:hypothetical protein